MRCADATRPARVILKFCGLIQTNDEYYVVGNFGLLFVVL